MYEIAPELKERPIFFMKFSKEKWTLESLRKGNLYMNTIGHFKKIEEETKMLNPTLFDGRLATVIDGSPTLPNKVA